jgi:hypothetical protein
MRRRVADQRQQFPGWSGLVFRTAFGTITSSRVMSDRRLQPITCRLKKSITARNSQPSVAM